MCAKQDEVFQVAGNIYAFYGLTLEQARSIGNGLKDRSAAWAVDLSRGCDGDLSLVFTLDATTVVVTRDRTGFHIAALIEDVLRPVACHRDVGSVIATMLTLLRHYADDQQHVVDWAESGLVPNWG